MRPCLLNHKGKERSGYEKEMMKTAKETFLRQMPQLDGLRALAALSVLWSHWSPVGTHFLGNGLGEMGVWLFFVLSGFLISGILLDARACVAAGQSKWFMLRQFYARRVLRIFPLYYLALAGALLLNVGTFRAQWPLHAAYLSNFYFCGKTDGAGSHLWSLAVEEQFYLCWPALILFTPHRLLLPAIVLLINWAPLFRFAMWQGLLPFNPPNGGFLTPSALDCLGVGALVAYAARNPSTLGPARLAGIILGAGIIGYGLAHVVVQMLPWKQTFLACLFGWLVWKGSVGFKGPAGCLLAWRPLTYLGKISYGIYVIHGFALFIWLWLLYAAPVPGYRVFHRLHVAPEVYKHQAFTIAAMAVITFVLAPLSWHCFEKPLNDLKRHFPYAKRVG